MAAVPACCTCDSAASSILAGHAKLAPPPLPNTLSAKQNQKTRFDASMATFAARCLCSNNLAGRLAPMTKWAANRFSQSAVPPCPQGQKSRHRSPRPESTSGPIPIVLGNIRPEPDQFRPHPDHLLARRRSACFLNALPDGAFRANGALIKIRTRIIKILVHRALPALGGARKA